MSAAIPSVNLSQGEQGAFRLAIAIGTLMCLAGCGSQSSPTSPTPTAPTPSPAALAAPSSSTFTGVDFANRSVSIAWAPSAGAQRYIVEAGILERRQRYQNRDGAPNGDDNNAGRAKRILGSYVGGLPPGIVYLGFKAANATGVSVASPERWVEIVDIRHVIEALFFFTGPFSPGQPRDLAKRMLGWADGSRVSVRVPNEWGGEQVDAVARTVEQANDVVAGTSFVIERASLTENQYNQLRPAGITILRGPSCVQSDGTTAACALSQGSPFFTTSQLRFPNPAAEQPRTIAHELGHTLGLNHLQVSARIDGSFAFFQNFRIQSPTMGSICLDIAGGSMPGLNCGGTTANGLSALELEAIRRVYASGLKPGSTAADFLARGLLVP